MFNESTLVLEGVTLAQVVELVVKVFVDLATGTVLYEKTAENTETTHPHDSTKISLIRTWYPQPHDKCPTSLNSCTPRI